MAPEQSTQTEYYSPNSYKSPPNTYQPPQNQQSQSQQQQQQGHFQPYGQFAQSYGQPFVPYQPPAQELPPTKPEVPRNEVWEKIKIGLHVTSIVFCICGMGISFSLINHGTAGYLTLYSLPVIILPLLWSAAEIATRWLRKNHHGIHPGAHVGVCLFIWMFTSIVGGMLCTFAAIGRDEDDYEYDSDCYNRQTRKYDLCESPMKGKWPSLTALAVFVCLIFVINFTLFVGACIDTAKRNAFNRARVMVVQQPYWGPMAQGWQPMPQQGQQGQYTSVAQQDVQMQDRQPTPNVTQSKGKEREVVPQEAEGSQNNQQNHSIREYYA